jgi:hypothetical protein
MRNAKASRLVLHHHCDGIIRVTIVQMSTSNSNFHIAMYLPNRPPFHPFPLAPATRRQFRFCLSMALGLHVCIMYTWGVYSGKPPPFEFPFHTAWDRLFLIS